MNEPSKWSGLFVREKVGSQGSYGFVNEDRGEEVLVFWKLPDGAYSRGESRKSRLDIVSPSPELEAWVKSRKLDQLVK